MPRGAPPRAPCPHEPCPLGPADGGGAKTAQKEGPLRTGLVTKPRGEARPAFVVRCASECLPRDVGNESQGADRDHRRSIRRRRSDSTLLPQRQALMTICGDGPYAERTL